MPLVGAGIGIKDDDAMVEISVGDEQLIGLSIHKKARRSSEVFSVIAAAILP